MILPNYILSCPWLHRAVRLLMVCGFMFSVVAGYSQYLVGGSASTLGSGCYQLTAALNGQAGYVYRQQALDLTDPFDLKFRVYLGTNNGGADGIVFVLRGTLATPYIGVGGGDLGYNGNGFSSNSLGIEVDTWYNGNYADMIDDHIGIFKNGSVAHNGVNALAGPVQASATQANIEDGNYHTLNIRWDPVAKELDVYLDCSYRLQYAGDLIDSVFNGDNTVFWGFLGTTGGANNVQRFCLTEVIDSLVNNLSDATICAGDSVQLDAGESAVTYAWSPSTGLSSATVNDPWAAPSTTTTYVVQETYLCDTLSDTVTVSVIQPTFNAFATVDDALCNGNCDGAIDMTVANGSGIYDFQWSNSATTEDISGLCEGTYTVTIQDVDTGSATYLCTLIESWTVDEPAVLTSTITNPSKTSCSDGTTCDASATAAGAGGTFPYFYLWTSGEVSPTANGLCADSNFVTVTDVNGCTSESFVIIDIPDTIRTTAYGDTQICISNVASIIAASVGGTPPFSYVWTSNALSGVVVSTDQSVNVSPLVTTQYFVTSTDANGCPGDTSEVIVKVRPPLDADVLPVDTICPYDTTSLFVQGIGGDSIYTYSWSIGLFGPTVAVSPDFPEWFTVTVSDLCGSPSFVDSVFVQVGGYSAIDVNIRIEDDSLCAGEVTHLIASGRGGFRGPDEYQFKWLHNGETNNILFVRPEQTRTYTAEISDLCLSEPGTATVTVHVGKPVSALIDVNPKTACAFSDVVVNLLNFNDKYAYTWYMGDSSSFVDYLSDSLVHRYSEPGCYDIEISTITNFGCYSTSKEDCAVRILSQPVAAFSTNPLHPTNTNELVMIENNALGAKDVMWLVGDDTLFNEQMIKRQIREWETPFTIAQIVESSDGCVDTLVKVLNYNYETLLYFPKSFTPNGDGLNDVFYVVGEAVSIVDFYLVIYDRWGHEVFVSKDMANGWDGRLPDGTPAPQGAYPISIRYRDHFGELKKMDDLLIVSKSGKAIPLR